VGGGGGGGGTRRLSMTVPVTRQTLDRAGYEQAQRAAIAGQYLASATDPFAVGQPKTGLEGLTSAYSASNPLFGPGGLTLTQPNISDYQHAQTMLQRIAGPSVRIRGHPGAAGVPVNASGHISPFPHGFIPNRLDAGFDGNFRHQIVAPFNGIITYAANKFSNWGGYLVIKSANGKISNLGTDSLYFAEGLRPTVHAGQRVRAGQTIALPAGSPYGDPYGHGSAGAIEWGLAQSGRVGQPTDPYAYVAANKRGSVLRFAQWARGFGIGRPTETSHAGYA
jgi:murein DD-endopeptidase MepM/ murein hydrolase activator NlpD